MYGRVARGKPLLSKGHLEFTKSHVKIFQSMRNKIWWNKVSTPWSEIRKRSSPGQYYLYSKEWWWHHHALGMFFGRSNWKTSQSRGKDEWMNEDECPETFWMITCSWVLWISNWRFVIQQANNPKHTAKRVASGPLCEYPCARAQTWGCNCC